MASIPRLRVAEFNLDTSWSSVLLTLEAQRMP